MTLEDIYRRCRTNLKDHRVLPHCFQGDTINGNSVPFITDNATIESLNLTSLSLNTLPDYRPFNINETLIQLCNGVPGIALTARTDNQTIYAHQPECIQDAQNLAQQFFVDYLLKEGSERRYKIVKSYEKISPH